MSQAFEITANDVYNVLRNRMKLRAPELTVELADELFAMLDHDEVEEIALGPNFAGDQTEQAYIAIERQIRDWYCDHAVEHVLKAQWSRVGNTNGMDFEPMAEGIVATRLDATAFDAAVAKHESASFLALRVAVHAEVDRQLVSIGVLEPSALPLDLYSVTLSWGEGEGDYCDSTWAQNEELAIRSIAEKMADESEVGFDDDADRQAFIDGRCENPVLVELVKSRVASDLEGLFHAELFGDGSRRSIDMDKLKVLIAANAKHLLVVPDVKSNRKPGL